MHRTTFSMVVTMCARFVVLLIMLGPLREAKPISRENDVVGNSNGTVTSLGSTAILSCVFTTAPPNCSWIFNNSVPLLLNSTDDDKYWLVGDVSKGNCSLQINNVSLNDVGSYTCIVVSQGRTWKAPNVTLQILDGPWLFDSNGTELTGEFHVNKQDQVYVTCVTNGTSPSTLQFLVDGKLQGTVVHTERLHNVSGSSPVPVTLTKSTLQMEAISIKSGARLQCRVQDDEEKEVVIIVHVHDVKEKDVKEKDVEEKDVEEKDVKEKDVIFIIGGVALLVVIAAACCSIIYYLHHQKKFCFNRYKYEAPKWLKKEHLPKKS